MKSLKTKTITETIRRSKDQYYAVWYLGESAIRDAIINEEVYKRRDPDYIERIAFSQILLGLLDDVQRLRPETKGLARDYVTLMARIEHEGVAFLGTSLCILGKAFDKGLSDGYFTTPPGFKRRKGEQIPLLFGGIFRDVFDSVTGQLKGDSSAEDVKILRQLLFFLEEAQLYASKRVKSHQENAAAIRAGRFTRKVHSTVSLGSYQPSLPFPSPNS